MKCDKCGLMLSVKDHKDINGKVILELTCRNPQCSNRGKVVTEVESGTPTADNKS